MEIVPLSAFRDNYIWAIVSDGYCVAVDPGDAAPVLRFLTKRRLALSAILLTHRHNDHIGGVKALFDLHGTIPVYGPRSDAIQCVTHHLAEDDDIVVPGVPLRFRIMEVPGHTEEHIAYYAPGILFCGDTLFAGGCGRLLGGTAAQLHGSLKKISRLPVDTKIYCAHEYTLSNLRFARTVEPHNESLRSRAANCIETRDAGRPTLPSLLGEELQTNPFLRCGEPTVITSVEVFSRTRLANEEEVFTALRRWKDDF